MSMLNTRGVTGALPPPTVSGSRRGDGTRNRHGHYGEDAVGRRCVVPPPHLLTQDSPRDRDKAPTPSKTGFRYT